MVGDGLAEAFEQPGSHAGLKSRLRVGARLDVEPLVAHEAFELAGIEVSPVAVLFVPGFVVIDRVAGLLQSGHDRVGVVIGHRERHGWKIKCRGRTGAAPWVLPRPCRGRLICNNLVGHGHHGALDSRGVIEHQQR